MGSYNDGIDSEDSDIKEATVEDYMQGTSVERDNVN